MPQRNASSRRSFLATAAAIGVAGAVGPRFLRGAEPAPRKTLRLGVAGGGFGATFAFDRHPDCVVAAVSDLRPARLARLQKTYRCNVTYPSLEAMIADPAIDAVVIATRAHDHAAQAMQCLAAGKHVLCAPPAATTLEACQALREAVTRSGMTYMLAEPSRWDAITFTARRYFSALGRTYMVESDLDRAAPTNFPSRIPADAAPILRAAASLNRLYALTDDRPTRVTCTARADADRPALAIAFFQSDHDNHLRISVTRGVRPKGDRERMHCHGDGRSLFLEDRAGACSIVRTGGRAAVETCEPITLPLDTLPEPLRADRDDAPPAHRFVTHEFVEACLARREPALDITQAIALAIPLIVARESALRDGEELKIPLFQ